MDYLYVNKNDFINEIFTLLSENDVNYLKVEASYLVNHVEKIDNHSFQTCRQGCVKWYVEPSENPDEVVIIEPSDCFPRLYFYYHSFLDEFIVWHEANGIKLLKIIVPLDESPSFDVELYKKRKLWRTMEVAHA